MSVDNESINVITNVISPNKFEYVIAQATTCRRCNSSIFYTGDGIENGDRIYLNGEKVCTCMIPDIDLGNIFQRLYYGILNWKNRRKKMSMMEFAVMDNTKLFCKIMEAYLWYRLPKDNPPTKNQQKHLNMTVLEFLEYIVKDATGKPILDVISTNIVGGKNIVDQLNLQRMKS